LLRFTGGSLIGGVTGVWKELTESVNSMASNLTAQVRNIAEVTIATPSDRPKRTRWRVLPSRPTS
jgi:hypothetical protein